MARGLRVDLNTKAIEAMIREAASSGRRVERFDAQEPSMVVRVTETGTATFALIGRAKGQVKQTRVTLGSFTIKGKKEGCITVQQARQLARDSKATLRQGTTPKVAAKAASDAEKQAASELFEHRVETFLARHASKNRTADQARRLVDKELRPAWSGRRLADISRADVIELLDKIVDRGAPIQANRVFALVRKFFRWSVGRGYPAVSPCGGMEKPAAEGQARERVLDDAELAEVWQAAEAMGHVGGAVVKALILTGQRRGEVMGMRWDELDLEAKTWSIAAERMKAKRAHVVHLSATMLEILEARPRVKGCPYVFTTDGATHYSDASGLKRRLDTLILEARQEDDPAAEAMADWRFHDLRRTMASGMARLRLRLEAIEKILHHTSGSFAGIVGVYQRHDFADERREALDAWARHVLRVIGKGETAEVIPICRATA